jgi:catechol 2,3-dioxygenase-like lactoylglutathione lyase family enzyme
MKFTVASFVIKISVSDMKSSIQFYKGILKCNVQNEYTINSGGKFGPMSYVQLSIPGLDPDVVSIGLYKDIDSKLSPMPQVGSVPSFLVSDIEKTLQYFKSKKVVIDKIDGQIILTNKSDKGRIDKFFFFRDPDNNSLVIRQNIN